MKGKKGGRGLSKRGERGTKPGGRRGRRASEKTSISETLSFTFSLCANLSLSTSRQPQRERSCSSRERESQKRASKGRSGPSLDAKLQEPHDCFFIVVACLLACRRRQTTENLLSLSYLVRKDDPRGRDDIQQRIGCGAHVARRAHGHGEWSGGACLFVV